MKNAILLHGACDKEEYFSVEYPSLSNSHWFPWLQKQLLINGILTQTPEFPSPYAPIYSEWKIEFERFPINSETILIGHSCGGGFLVRWLSESKIKVDKVILVAPWFDPDKTKTSEFFEFTIDPMLFEYASSLEVFVSDNDETDIHTSVEILCKAVPRIKIRRFTGLGHFTLGDMNKTDFPELLETILEK